MEVHTTGQITKYIASQGPMQHTCKDLWQVSAAVMSIDRCHGGCGNGCGGYGYDVVAM